MTLGQMETLAAYANRKIDFYAAGNKAFDRDREQWRTNLDIIQGDPVHGVFPFFFKLRDEHHVVLLNPENDVVHATVGRAFV